MCGSWIAPRRSALAPQQQLFEALNERMIPGTGEFPLHEFVAVLPPHLPIGIEVPLKSLKDKGVVPLERARLAVEASRQILADARAITRSDRLQIFGRE
jgi:hypothetical protein